MHTSLKNILALMALAIWLLASWSGAHGHLCFDGQEPPVTVHMELLGDHPEHGDNERHVDADLDVSQLLIVKLVKIDLPLLMVAALLLVLLFKQSSTLTVFYFRIFSSRLIGFRPPLRAPPALPA